MIELLTRYFEYLSASTESAKDLKPYDPRLQAEIVKARQLHEKLREDTISLTKGSLCAPLQPLLLVRLSCARDALPPFHRFAALARS